MGGSDDQCSCKFLFTNDPPKTRPRLLHAWFAFRLTVRRPLGFATGPRFSVIPEKVPGAPA